MTGRREETRSQSQAGSHRSQERLRVCASHRSRSRVLTSLSVSQSDSGQLLLHSHLITGRGRDPSPEDVAGLPAQLTCQIKHENKIARIFKAKYFFKPQTFKFLNPQKFASLLWFCASLVVRGKVNTALDINNNSLTFL